MDDLDNRIKNLAKNLEEELKLEEKLLDILQLVAGDCQEGKARSQKISEDIQKLGNEIMEALASRTNK